MNIQVRFFASLRESLECDELALRLADGSTTEDLLVHITRRIGDTASVLLSTNNVRVAINKEIRELPVALRDGDEVAFMPPVTGG